MIESPAEALQAVFDASVPEPNSGCWLFLGFQPGRGGYGSKMYRGRAYMAHRLAFEAATGIDPGKRQVCHKCDVRCCVNPDHLWLGTQVDNMADMVAKGRQWATLTEEDAVAILGDGRSRRELAKAYGVTYSTIAGIKTGRQWARATGLAPPQRLRAGATAVLAMVKRQYPLSVARQDLAATLGYTVNSIDAFNRELKIHGLIVEASRGKVRASDNLFGGR